MYLEQAFNQIFQENKTTQEFKIHKVSTRKVQIKSDEAGAKNSLKLEFVLHFSFWRDFDQIFLGKSTCITALIASMKDPPKYISGFQSLEGLIRI